MVLDMKFRVVCFALRQLAATCGRYRHITERRVPSTQNKIKREKNKKINEEEEEEEKWRNKFTEKKKTDDTKLLQKFKRSVFVVKNGIIR